MIRVTGDGFLRHMVRTIAGTLVDVGLGRWPASYVARSSRAATARAPAAPRRRRASVSSRVDYDQCSGLTQARACDFAPSSSRAWCCFIMQSIAACLECPRKTLYHRGLLALLRRWRSMTSCPLLTSGSPEEALARQVDFDRLPRHVAVIMDGNGRWAAQRHLPRVEGHRAGIDSVRDVVESSARLGIQVLTLYAFSVENWKRPAMEVSTLMSLLKRYLRLELNTLLRNNIRFHVIGREEELARDIRAELKAAEAKTAGNTGMLFNIALNYGGRAEIVEAARRLLAAQDSSRGARRAALRRVSLHSRPARSRSADPHERRDARQQLPALADCLRRDLGHRHAVAGFPQARSARSHARLSEARSPLRRHQQARGRRPLMTRVLSALVLAALVLGVVCFLPPEATLLLAVLASARRLRRVRRPRRRARRARSPSIPSGAAVAAACVAVGGDEPPLDARLSRRADLRSASSPSPADSRDPRSLRDASASLFPLLYIGMPLGALAAIRSIGGRDATLLLMATIIVSDSAQYYTGPRASAGTSWRRRSARERPSKARSAGWCSAPPR